MININSEYSTNNSKSIEKDFFFYDKTLHSFPSSAYSEKLMEESSEFCSNILDDASEGNENIFKENSFLPHEFPFLNLLKEEENFDCRNNLNIISKDKLNQTSLEKKDSSQSFFINNLTRKKIRKTNEKNIIQIEKKKHDKNSSDNLLRKIQVHYLTFIVDYLNDILKSCNIKKQFLKFDYKLKKQINKDNIEFLKHKNIGDIVCYMKISNKYKQYQDKSYNKKLYEIIKENQLLNKVFSENYLTLFKKVYYANKRIINLNEYGFNKEIILSDKVKTIKDLLLKNRDDQKMYNNSINGCIIQNFLSNSIFSVNYIN